VLIELGLDLVDDPDVGVSFVHRREWLHCTICYAQLAGLNPADEKFVLAHVLALSSS